MNGFVSDAGRRGSFDGGSNGFCSCCGGCEIVCDVNGFDFAGRGDGFDGGWNGFCSCCSGEEAFASMILAESRAWGFFGTFVGG